MGAHSVAVGRKRIGFVPHCLSVADSQDRTSSLEEARVQRLTDEELEAEIISLALTLGMPEELAHGDPEAALASGAPYLAWGAEYLRTVGAREPE